jgi:hypothetical protein
MVAMVMVAMNNTHEEKNISRFRNRNSSSAVPCVGGYQRR